MTDRQIEERLKQEVEACVPDVLERVMAHCDTKKGQVIIMPKKKNVWIKVAAIAACLALVLGISVFAFAPFGGNVATVVTLDVNPSIELKLDKDARVLEANALNEDAAIVLKGMDLKDTQLLTATNAIVGSLLKNGYLHQLANAILISVEDKDSVRGETLQRTLSQEVDSLLTAASLNAAVLSQYVTRDVDQLSSDYAISHGKAALIDQLLVANPSYSFEELSHLSVQELSLLMENPKNQVKTIATTGTVSDSAYIGKEKAKSIALQDAGIAETEVTDLDIDFGYEYGVLVYEVDFDHGTTEYEYDINATTGEIVHSHREEEHNNNSSGSVSTQPDETDIGEAEAKAIALTHAGVSESEVSSLRVFKEKDDGRWEYKVEFFVGNIEYDYEILASNGRITDFDKEIEDDRSHQSGEIQNSEPAAPSSQITEAEAKTIALNHAGVSEADVTGLRVHTERDDGRMEYQVEFRIGNVEYEYEILATDGRILDYDKEVDD